MPIHVQDVVAAAADLLAREDLAAKARRGEAGGEVDLLIACCHYVESELAAGPFPLRTKESAAPLGKKIPFSSLQRPPVNILSVCSPSGMGIPFELYPDHIEIDWEGGEVEVKYTFSPKEKSLSDELECGIGCTLQMFALGTSSRYLLSHGQYAEAELFEERYKSAVGIFRGSDAKLSLRARRWA